LPRKSENMFNKRGFTLIELLVVVAIIGLLSSVIFVNLNSTRPKAHDANIKSLMHQLRNAAEMLYNDNSNNYDLVCTEDNKLSDNGELGVIKRALERENPGYETVCIKSADKKDFAASFPLLAEKGKYWCVESVGASMELSNPITLPNCQ